jgi:hypothetical protein
MSGIQQALSKWPSGNKYFSLMFQAKHLASNRVLVGIPMTGVVRSEWALARYSQVIPCNWSQAEHIQWMHSCAPIGYAVAEARNVIVHEAVTRKFEWLFFIDSDVILPPDCFVRINRYMLSGKYPVVSGLYFAKCYPPEPLLYRGRGNSHFTKWELGEKVMVDGIPMGCTLIHVKVLEQMYADAPVYVAGGNKKVRKVFDTPSGVLMDPQNQSFTGYAGTEDMAWCNRVIAGKYLQKAGFSAIGKRRYPFLCDTGIFCRHITPDGISYPLGAT